MTDVTNNSPKPRKFTFKKRDGIFVLLGVLLAFSIRFIFVDAVVTHHHANFALYVNGQRDEFSSFTFYEEVASCSSENHNDPKARIHMHNQTNDVIHVHAAGATWGDFFANLGYTLGNKVLVRDDGIYTDAVDGNQLIFILNGERVSSIANRAVESKDRLLIDYGKTTDSELNARAEAVADNAGEYNTKPDPASCSGAENEKLSDRFWRTLGISRNASDSHASGSHNE
jgi:hypothetical protein